MTAEVPVGLVAVLCAVRGAGESEVVTALSAPGSGILVTRRCADLTELLAAAAAGAGRVAVVSADLPSLDRDAVAHLHDHGARVVAISDGSGWQDDRLRALGVDVVIVSPTPHELTAGVHEAATTAPDGSRPPAGPDQERSVPPTDPEPPRQGRLVAVWGPTGAPGRTTIAINLATELAGPPSARRRVLPGLLRRGAPVSGDVQVPDAAPRGPSAEVLLVDADTYGASVAQHLGLLDESPGLAAAARSAGQGALDRHGLATLTPSAVPGMRLLTGISRAARWPELPGASLDVVWEHARELADWTVVDCGFGLETDEMLTYDTRAPQRNAATLSALAAADVVVVVGSADPVGVQRLVRGLGELTDTGAATGALRMVVANRVRASVVGPRPEAAVREAMARYAGVHELHTVPEDRDACDTALREGRALAEVAPDSAVRRSVAALAADLRARLDGSDHDAGGVPSLETAH
ncbi:AAA family ATPase [Oerskovia flava]|uniref:AAA family ATPase n=1 Tax=Oerskovia flava TaxID=2986422 RepID=UPI0022404D19|nr:hypothetical protein [Oerskovia sp. JB1-3-2]